MVNYYTVTSIFLSCRRSREHVRRFSASFNRDTSQCLASRVWIHYISHKLDDTHSPEALHHGDWTIPFALSFLFDGKQLWTDGWCRWINMQVSLSFPQPGICSRQDIHRQNWCFLSWMGRDCRHWPLSLKKIDCQRDKDRVAKNTA